MEGLIYKTQPYLENDRLLFLYTPQGKITLIAKGSQKMTSSARVLGQYLTQIEFKETPNRAMYSLVDGKILNDYQMIKNDYDLAQYAAAMLYMVDSCVADTDRHDEIYKDLIDTLHQFKPEMVLAFGFRLVKRLGFPMSLKPDGRVVKGFNIQLGSLVYQDEPYLVDLDLGLTTLLLKLIHLSYDTIDKIENISFLKLKTCLIRYYEHHLDTHLRHL